MKANVFCTWCVKKGGETTVLNYVDGTISCHLVVLMTSLGLLQQIITHISSAGDTSKYCIMRFIYLFGDNLFIPYC